MIIKKAGNGPGFTIHDLNLSAINAYHH